MFKNQFPEFKPELGNEYHIRILDRMKEYYVLRETYENILKSRKISVETRKKCIEMKKKIREMIEFSQKKD